jgi:hypothetical protein
MYKKTLIKLIKKEDISQKEFIEFISEYIYLKKKVYPTSDQLKTIIRLAYSGNLDIDYITKEAAKDLNIQIVYLERISELNKQIINIYVYE